MYLQEIDVLCDGEYIPKDHTLKFVYVTRWRTKPSPLKFRTIGIDVDHPSIVFIEALGLVKASSPSVGRPSVPSVVSINK